MNFPTQPNVHIYHSSVVIKNQHSDLNSYLKNFFWVFCNWIYNTISVMILQAICNALFDLLLLLLFVYEWELRLCEFFMSFWNCLFKKSDLLSFRVLLCWFWVFRGNIAIKMFINRLSMSGEGNIKEKDFSMHEILATCWLQSLKIVETIK